MKNLLKLLTLTAIAMVILSCKKTSVEDCPVCNLDSVNTTFSITKLNVNCSELNLTWDLDFGARFRVKAETTCDNTCDKNIIAYYYRTLRKTPTGIDTLAGRLRAGFYGYCNSSAGFQQTLNTEAGEEQEYFIGDTIQYEIHQIGICHEQDLENGSPYVCDYDEIEVLDLPFLSDSYILRAEDFDCE